MSTQYLLPCDCGKKTLVDVRSAGQTLRCECGANIEVPTLRGLSKLEAAGESRPAVQSNWSPARGFAFLLLVVSIVAAAGTMLLYQKISVSTAMLGPPMAGEKVEAIMQSVNRLPAGSTYSLWMDLRNGPDRRADSPNEADYKSYMARLRNWMIFTATLSVVGLVGAVLGALVGKQKSPSAPTQHAGSRAGLSR